MTQNLITPRLLIRPLTLKDSSAIFAYRSDPAVVRYQMWKPQKEVEVRQFIREQQGLSPGMPGIWFQFALIHQVNAKLIGDCGIHVPLENIESAEVGLTLATPYQTQGFATEALTAVLRFCFSTLHLHRVLARTVKRNFRSIALIRRLNFHPARAEEFGLQSEAEELFFVLEKRVWENEKESA